MKPILFWALKNGGFWEILSPSRRICRLPAADRVQPDSTCGRENSDKGCYVQRGLMGANPVKVVQKKGYFWKLG